MGVMGEWVFFSLLLFFVLIQLLTNWCKWQKQSLLLVNYQNKNNKNTNSPNTPSQIDCNSRKFSENEHTPDVSLKERRKRFRQRQV